MSSGTIIYAADRFQRSIDNPSVTERVFSAVGRFKTPGEVSDPAAITYGKRRLQVLGATVLLSAAIIGSAFTVHESKEAADRYGHKIEACASEIVGSQVTISQDMETGMDAVDAQDFPAVQACRSAAGNLELAKFKLGYSAVK